MVDAIDGKFISLSISEDEESPILSVLVSPKANIGLVLLEMERTAKKLRKLFE
jgi:predicted regulator of Ras-like GTPase activity (Roadblock/LC7/MglB family)